MKKSSRSGVLGVVVIIFLIAAGVFIVKFGNKNTEQTPEPVSNVQVDGVGAKEGGEPISGTGSLSELATRGEDLECQVILERAETEGNIEGTSFFSKGNMRADFMVPAPELGGKIVSSMITGGSSMYVWSTINGSTFGFKTSAKSTDKDQIDTKEPVSMNANIRYTCTKWTELDGSVFVPPADIEFKDLEPIIKAGPEDGTLPN
jgi:hypothetical protein